MPWSRSYGRQDPGGVPRGSWPSTSITAGDRGVRSDAIEGAIGSGVTGWGNQQRGWPYSWRLPPLVTPQRRRTHYEVAGGTRRWSTRRGTPCPSPRAGPAGRPGWPRPGSRWRRGGRLVSREARCDVEQAENRGTGGDKGDQEEQACAGQRCRRVAERLPRSAGASTGEHPDDAGQSGSGKGGCQGPQPEHRGEEPSAIRAPAARARAVRRQARAVLSGWSPGSKWALPVIASGCRARPGRQRLRPPARRAARRWIPAAVSRAARHARPLPTCTRRGRAPADRGGAG